MTEQGKQKVRLTRDACIVAFALTAAGFEITIGGARPSVLTFLTGLLLTPVVMRADESRRNQ